MSAVWASLAFATPWLLLALLALPLIWWMLRATPPAPKRIGFPAIALVRGLQPKEVTASKTPWWLLLLRLGAVAALIIAFAGPLLSPETSESDVPLLLVVDDTGQAAHDWQARQNRMTSLLAQAQRKGRSVYFMTTAEPNAELQGPMTAGNLTNLVKTFQPKAMLTDRQNAVDQLSQFDAPRGLEVVWLSDGLASQSTNEGDEAFQTALKALGDVKIYLGTEQTQDLRLLPPVRDGREILVTAERLTPSTVPQPLRLVATDIDGKLVVEKDALIEAEQKSVTIELDLPREVRNRLYRLEIAGQTSVAGVQLMDDRWQSRSIGLIAASVSAQQGSPSQQNNRFLNAAFYIETALDSFADVSVSNVDALLEKPKSVLFWPDAAQLGSLDQDKLEDWVEAGGTLVRFAGPNLANDTLEQLEPIRLLPVGLRAGNRSIGGALDWDTAARLQAFSDISSFADLRVSKEIEIKRQILAEPSLDLEDKTWVTLEDGTPLVTSSVMGEGRLIFFHTTASPRWSNLSLSGLFVDMLQKIIENSASNGQQVVAQSLKPVSLLDAFGRSRGPQSQDMQVTPEILEAQTITIENQPGLYGTQSERRALNFSNANTGYEPLAVKGADILPYQGAVEVPLKHWLLIAAFLMLIADFFIRMAMNGAFSPATRSRVVAVSACLVLFMSMDGFQQRAIAQESRQEVKQREAVLETRLGYIRTGDARIDATSRAGLFGLTRWITRKSSIQLGMPTSIDLEQDELIFHPMVYWPISPEQKPLAPELVAKVNAYMAAGGMLLIDTRDAGFAQTDSGNRTLIRALRGLSIPALVPVPETHVLTKSFYLLSWFPGRWSEGDVWVAANATSDAEAGLINDGVSPVVVGSVDWASAWAIDDAGSPLFPVVPGVNRQREFAYRFGMNVVMYALAGNYKADQVHVQTILDRLKPNQSGTRGR